MISVNQLSARDKHQIQESQNLARLMAKAGLYDQAVAAIDAILTSIPTIESALLLGRLALENNDQVRIDQVINLLDTMRVQATPAEDADVAAFMIDIMLHVGQAEAAFQYADSRIAAGQDVPSEICIRLLKNGAQEFAPAYVRLINTLDTCRPHDVAIHHVVALACLNVRRFSLALRATDRLRAVEPGNCEWAVLTGFALIGAHAVQEAVDFLEQFHKHFPDHARLAFVYGNALSAAARFDAAAAVFRSALQIHPDHAEFHVHLGMALAALRHYDDAMVHIREGLAIDPAIPDGYANLASVFMRKNSFVEAEALLQKVVTEGGQVTETVWRSLANIYQNTIRQGDAVTAYEHALALNDTDLTNWAGMMMASDYADDIPEEKVFGLHRAFGRFLHDTNPPAAPHVLSQPDNLCIVGLASGDFNNHVCARFTLPLLEWLKGFGVHVVLLSSTLHTDHITDTYRRMCGDWVDATEFSNAQLVNQMRRRGVQLLIDLSGHTAFNRIGVFARKAAPVQVSWLGYPNTTGLDTIDFRITDGWADPEGMTDQWFTEKLVRLPRCFLAYQAPDEDGLVPHARGEGHYSSRNLDRPLVFGSLNNLAKITPSSCRLWAQAVLAVPGSRLLIQRDPMGDPLVQQYFRTMFEQAGIAPDRLDLRPHDPTMRHLTIYEEIDVALDCFPYNGTTTTCEAIMSGVPVVTLAGKTHRSRVGVSLLNAIGKTGWIAETPEQFIEICRNMNDERQQLRLSRAERVKEVLATPLFDTYDFAVHFWEAISQGWRDVCIR